MRENSWLILSIPILMLTGCNATSTESMVYLGQNFLLEEAQYRNILETEMTIEAVTIIDGLDGSHEPGAGSVYLSVDNGIEENIEVYLETGSWKTLGEYEIHLIEVTSDGEGLKASLLVR